MPPVTRRQNEVLGFIREFLNEHGYSPTLDEIARHFGMTSLNGVYKHLKGLEQRGLIRRLNKHARSIQLIEQEDRRKSTLPLLGRVAAGRPIEAVQFPEEIEVPGHFVSAGSNNYVLKVQGDSMIEEHIQDGDYVVLEHRERAENGEIVMALIDGETATLKKYYREGNQIRLQPANPSLSAIVIPEERLTIQGVLIGLMRKY